MKNVVWSDAMGHLGKGISMKRVIRLHSPLLCFFVGLLVLALFPVPLGAARGAGKTEVMPVQTTAPAAVVLKNSRRCKDDLDSGILTFRAARPQ